MKPIKVLFVCIHNSARSQMAEAFLRKLGGEMFSAESAGIEAGVLNPYAVQVMLEAGIDISHHRTKTVSELYERRSLYDYVITVCYEGHAAKCPVFPGVHQKQNWSFDDPSAFEGSPEQKAALTRMVRDQIKEAVQAFIEKISHSNSTANQL